MSFRPNINTNNKRLKSNFKTNNTTNNKKRVSIQEQPTSSSDQLYQDLSLASSIDDSSSQSLVRQESQILSLHSSDESGIESTESDSLLKTTKRSRKKFVNNLSITLFPKKSMTR